MARRMGGFDFLTMKKQFKNNLFAIFFLFLLLFPFFMLFKDFFQPKDLINIKDPQTLRILGFTCYQSFLSTVISFFITLLPSYFSAKNKGVLSKLLENSIFIPFFFPPVSAVIAFSLLFSSTGLLAKSGIKINIMYSFTAIIIAHVFYNSPIFVKYLSEGLRRIPQSLKESAYVEGAGKVKTFFYIELPLILPSISRAFFLVFTYSFTSFAIVLNLGGIKYSTLEVAIATTLKGTLNFSKALSYALIQFIVLTLINIFMSKFEPQSFEYNEPEYSANKKTGKLSLVEKINATNMGVTASITPHGKFVLRAGNFVDFDLANVVIKGNANLFDALGLIEDSSNNIITITSPDLSPDRIESMFSKADLLRIDKEIGLINQISVSQNLMSNPSLLAIDLGIFDGNNYQPIGAGSVTVWDQITQLRYSPILDNGRLGFSDFLANMITEIGVKGETAQKMKLNSESLNSQITIERERVMGVSIDEEVTNLIKYQQAFNACARVITAIDQMLSTVVSSMGVV
jgi:ABC-type sulfate transport system permease component